jgi:hypothetical protein
MEILERELDFLIDKLSHSGDFRNDLENLQSVYPFNKYDLNPYNQLNKSI